MGRIEDGVKMIRQKFLIMWLFVLSATVVVTASESNSVDVRSGDKKISTPVKIGDGQENNKNKQEKKKEEYVVENEVLKYAVKSYEESIATLRWAIGGIITLIGILAAAVGYVVVRYSREYKEAVSEAKEASKEASRYAEKAEEKLAEIDKKVEGKLKEIEDKGKTQIAALIKEAEKHREESQKEAERQRKISELWNDGLRSIKDKDYESAAYKFKQIVEDFNVEDAAVYNNWGVALLDLAEYREDKEAERLFSEATAKCEKAVAIKPNFHEAYGNWGIALSGLAICKKGDEANRLFADAIAKYEKSVAIKPEYHAFYVNWGAALSELSKLKEGDEAERLFAKAIGKYEKAVSIRPDYYNAYNSWGVALLDLARRKEGDERKTLMEEAKEKLLKAESIKRGEGAYNLACANCLMGDEEECKRWLKVGQDGGTLPTREYAMKDEDFESVRNKEWFKEIHWKSK